MSAAIQVSAYRWVPPFAQGYVRDLRVRWALEEAGLPRAQVQGAVAPGRGGLCPHRHRSEARPAFGRAVAAQLQNFRDNAPPTQAINP